MNLLHSKNRKVRKAGAALAGALCLSVSIPMISAYATSVDDLKEQQEQAAGEAEELQQAKQELEKSLGSMNLQLYNISAEIEELQQEQENTRLAIEQTQGELENAEAAAQQQYEDMKLRIQFMYENSEQLSWTLLLSSESFTDFLNRSQYLQSIASADKRLMEEYEQTLQTIETAKIQLEEEQLVLAENEVQLQEKQSELLGAIADKQTQIAETENSMQQAEDEAAQLSVQIAAMEEYERKLEEQKAAEEAARLEAEKNTAAGNTASGSTNTNAGAAIPVEVGEEELLAAIIYCESGGESYESQLAVGSVVLNRVSNPYFPDTITGVIYQNRQFSPVASGRLAVVLEKNLTTESCRNAAREVLSGNITGDWLYFRMASTGIEGTVIGKQVFY